MTNRFAEIGQDAAGILEFGSKAREGLFTADVESCVVYVFLCEQATIMVHDSGQLSLNSIAKLVADYGAVNKLYYVYGSARSPLHFARVKRLLPALGIASVDDERMQPRGVGYPNFSVVYHLNGRLETLQAVEVVGLADLDHKAQRQAVCEINNLFHPRNAQALSLDVQFKNGEYQPVRCLDQSVQKLLAVLPKEPDFFFKNLAVLMGGHQAGVLTLPAGLQAFGEQYDIGQFRTRHLDVNDEMLQDRLFDQFMANANKWLL